MTTSMCSGYEQAIVITNRMLVKGDFLTQLEKVIRLHPHALILREKDLDDAAYENLVKKVMQLCDREKVACFVHSRIGIARKMGCKNIHLSIPVLQSLSESEKADLRENFSEISVSCHCMQDVRIAEENGATQIILGTIFETDCKKGIKGRGVEFVREICQNSSLPIYAIGGISLERMAQVVAAGAAGGCMMSGFMRM